MAKNANSILARIGIGGFVLLLIGAAAGIGIFSLLRKPKVITQYEPQVQYEIKDTCLTMLDSFVLIRKDSFQYYTLISGEEQTDNSSPKIDYVRESTQEEDVKITKYSKQFDWGLTKGSVEFKIRHKGEINIEDWEMKYSVDTVLAREVFRETETIILRPSIPNITVPAPTITLPENKDRMIVGGTGGLVYTDKLFYSAGAYVTTKSDITFKAEKFINSQGGQIEVMLPISKMFRR